MINLLDSILLPKKNESFELAKKLVKEAIKFNQQEDCQMEFNTWNKIIPKDVNSPLVMGMENESHMVYYPKYSTPYDFPIGEECIFVEVMHGELYEKYSGKKYREGDKVKFGPNIKIMPYTRNNDARIKVSYGNCEDDIMDICR